MLTFITGLGRCGTSLTMQMLHAAGYPVLGRFPAYETVYTEPGGSIPWRRFEPLTLPLAVKLVDPVNSRLQWGGSAINARAVFLTRNHTEQAKSAIKWTEAIIPGIHRTKPNVEKMRASYARDEPLARQYMASVTKGRLLVIDFADLVGNPADTAGLILDFLQAPPVLGTIEVMAAQVRKRGPKALPFLLEQSLISYGRLRTPMEAIREAESWP